MTKHTIALLLPLTLAACGDDAARLDITLPVRATVAGAPVDCTTTYTDLGTSGASARLADARLFLSQPQLRDATGAWIDLELDETAFQHGPVALLDFEDATGACADSGTPETNTTITGSIPDGDYDALRVHIGVPFDLNHVDNTTAPAPLNVPGMFWIWQGGYKFVRVDWLVDQGAVPRWNIHIGSTGCVSSAPTEAPTETCARPNTSTVEITGMNLQTDTLDIDLAALVANADLIGNTTDTPPGCMSSATEPDDCTPVFSALGMNFDDGQCQDTCAGQTTLSIAP